MASIAMATANLSRAQTWSATSPGELSDGTNWSGGVAPNAANATATISTQPTNSGNFTLNSSTTLGTLNYSNTQTRSVSGTGVLTLSLTTDTPTISLTGGDLAISNVVAGTRGLQKTGAGVLTLGTANTYSGNTVVVGGGAVNTGEVDGSVIADQSVNSSFGRGNFNLSSFGAINYTGGNAATNRTITVGTGGGAVGVSNVNTTLTLTNTINGGGDLNKLGAGTLQLNAANTYSGGTAIAGGKLLANNGSGSATGAGQIAVNSSGTLAGSGAVSGPVVVNSGGTLAPGDGIGGLSVGSLTFNASSTLSVEMKTSASLSVAADLLSSTGSLSIINGALISITNSTPGTAVPLGTKFTLISYLAGTWNGGTFVSLPDDSQFTLGANTFAINYNDTSAGSNFGGGAAAGNNYLTLTAVPEASSIFFGALACAGVTLFARLRKLRYLQVDA
ncbi:MAG TPA: autotransporter-associated beta strand repeat-containing protein [Lacipirellulaceae bacterium]|nr:autotransporter-associated beta strand repeat-containing protein [Lacipirellulaceae bacterium]